MKISFRMLERSVAEIGRSLLTPSPHYANGTLALSGAIQRERARRRQALLDTWFEVRSSLGVGYIIEYSNGGGEYRRTLPEGVPPSSAIRIEVPEGSAEASGLLEQLDGLIRTFQATASFVDVPTKEMLEFAGSSAERDKLGDLIARLQNIRNASAPQYDKLVVSSLLLQLREAMIGLGQDRYTELRGVVSMIRQTAETMRTSFLADCMVTSLFVLVDELSNELMEESVRSGRSRADAQTAYVHRIGELNSLSNPEPMQALGFFLARVFKAGGADAAINLASSCFDRGSELIDEALDAPTRFAHGNALYRAGLLMYCSSHTFRALVDSAPRLPAMNLPEVKQRWKVAEENSVKIGHALLFALENRGDRKLQMQRQRLADLAAQKKTATVNADITATIEQKYFYPRVFRQYLTGSPIPSDE